MAQAADEPGCGTTVLVVEDTPEICHLIAAELAEDGLDVATAATGWEAALWLEGERPALVVEDMGVPFGGHKLALLLRGLHGEVPLVALAGDAAEAQLACRDRAAVVLSPPYDLDELVTAVRRLAEAGAG